jgi:hypothetical protein
MKKNFVMRGQTPSGETEILNFGGYKPGYAYRLVEFEIYPSTNVGGAHYELAATLTAAKVEEDPVNPDFTNEGLIGTVLLVSQSGIEFYGGTRVINDTFLITQDLILSVIDTVAGSPMAVNWQCRFEAVKMSGPEEAATNFKQFTIFDG